MTFYGPLQMPHEAGDHAHESPNSMCLQLIVLAACAALVGVLFDWSWIGVIFDSAWANELEVNYFAEFLLSTPSLAHEAARATSLPGIFHGDIVVLSCLIAIAGLALSAFLYLGHHAEINFLSAALARLGLYQLSRHKFFVDEIYAVLIVWPLRGLAAASYLVDRWIIHGLGDGREEVRV